jgi:eukaryotic-like serine/threonine-protein kinase
MGFTEPKEGSPSMADPGEPVGRNDERSGRVGTAPFKDGFDRPGTETLRQDQLPTRVLPYDSGKQPRAETGLLRTRLRAAALYLAVAQSSLLVWRLLSAGEPLWRPHLALIVLIAACYGALSIRGPVPSLALRIIETAIFGLTALFLAFRQYDWGLHAAAAGSATAYVVILKNTIISSILVMLCYCMLIPGNWKRAARVALAIALLPLLTQALLVGFHPSVRHLALGVATWERIGENFVILSLAAGLSIYGTHVITSLRTEAAEARQLNQYRLGRRLGVGGMGEVYLAEHQLLKRPCALKVIRPDYASHATTLARFEREVRAMARLSHPNTVEIFDYGRGDDGTFFYVMEYLPGLDLDQLVTRHGPMPPGRVIYLLRQACEALAEAHAIGLIHRDLKPANIIAARRGGKHDFAKILDYGLVRETTPDYDVTLSREGTVRGTPMFIAPEQAMGGRDLDHRSDLYTIGGVAYYLLTGRGPFDCETMPRMLIAHARDPVEPPSRINPNVPPDLEKVILRCLEKAPSDRYPDASSLADAFAACTAAADWNDHIALAWWREFEPDVEREAQGEHFA